MTVQSLDSKSSAFTNPSATIARYEEQVRACSKVRLEKVELEIYESLKKKFG